MASDRIILKGGTILHLQYNLKGYNQKGHICLHNIQAKTGLNPEQVAVCSRQGALSVQPPQLELTEDRSQDGEMKHKRFSILAKLQLYHRSAPGLTCTTKYHKCTSYYQVAPVSTMYHQVPPTIISYHQVIPPDNVPVIPIPRGAAKLLATLFAHHIHLYTALRPSSNSFLGISQPSWIRCEKLNFSSTSDPRFLTCCLSQSFILSAIFHSL